MPFRHRRRKRRRGERETMIGSRHKLIAAGVALAFIAMGCSSSKKSTAASPTTTAASATTATTGSTATTTGGGSGSGATPVNVKASQAVKNDPLTGPKGSGLTRGVTATSVKIGCFGQISQFTG